MVRRYLYQGVNFPGPFLPEVQMPDGHLGSPVGLWGPCELWGEDLYSCTATTDTTAVLLVPLVRDKELPSMRVADYAPFPAAVSSNPLLWQMRTRNTNKRRRRRPRNSSRFFFF